MIRIEPRGLALQPDETANRQPRADEQHERQRDFSSDEGRPDPALAAAVAACSLPEIVVDVQMEELVGRCETGEQAGEGRDSEAEEQHAGVDRHRARDVEIGRTEADERSDQPHGEQHAGRAAEHCEDDAFGQELAENPPAARAERDADCHLLAPPRRAGNEQPGHVPRGDEEEQADSREEQQDGLPDVGDEVVAQRRQQDTGVPIVVREIVLHRRRDCIHVRLRALDRPPRLETRQHRNVFVASLRRRIRHRSQRIVRYAPVRCHPYTRLVRILDARRRDADDGVGLVVEPDGLANRIGPPSEALPPEPVGDDRDARRAGLFVRGVEPPAERRLDVEHAEEVHVDNGSRDALGTVGAREREPRLTERGQSGEAVMTNAPVERVGWRRVAVTLSCLPIGVRYQHQIVRAGERQRPYEHGVDDAEDRGVGADADRNREDREEEKARRPPERARGVAEILKPPLNH